MKYTEQLPSRPPLELRSDTINIVGKPEKGSNEGNKFSRCCFDSSTDN